MVICYDCINPLYISDCESKYLDEKPSNLNTDKCHQYDPINSVDGTCCYIKYGKIVSYTYTYYYYYKKNLNHTNRKLDANLDYYYSCIGLTKEGYDNIETVIDELLSEKAYDTINIYCFSQFLKIFSKLFLILLLSL